MNYRNQSQHDPSVGRENYAGRVSQTVPDMTLPLKTLIERYTRGQSVATFTPVFNGDSDMPDVTRMTPQERLDFARSIKDDIARHRSRLAEPEPSPISAPLETREDDV